jgi:regulatory protein|tara:strand:- start:650 stop:1285 length:636 start_codon:yes stop_codon:yes gene_type:complete
MKKRKILSIKRSNRYNDRIIVKLDDKSVFRVPEDAFILNPFHVGETVTVDEIEDYDDKMRLQEAKDAAFKLLSFRMRSIAEMRKRLKEKSFSQIEVDQVIDKLTKLNYLNDVEFGKAFVKEKIKNKKIGPKAIKSELFPHQLSPDFVDELIESVYKKYKINDLITFHLKRKKIKKNTQMNKSDLSRLNNYLLRKGFEWDNINGLYVEWGLI